MAATFTVGPLIGDVRAPSVILQFSQDQTARNVTFSGRDTRTGQEWTVAGTPFLASQNTAYVFTDARAPLATEVVYSYTIEGSPGGSASPITITATADLVIQNLDASLQAFPILLDGDFVRERLVRASVFDIPGRSRPVVRYTTSGDGGSEYTLLTSIGESARLWALLASGAPLLLRSKPIHDMPPSEYVHVESASSVVQQDDSSRVWTFAFTYIDDPDSSVVPAVRTWAHFDKSYAASTWFRFDAEWVNSTWAAFDLVDWSRRAS